MNEAHIAVLASVLITLMVLSAFFSSTETALMSVNRYRLKHLAKTSANARRVQKLLERPDRLLGMILLGNTFVNIFASAVGTLIAVRLFGDAGVVIASIAITFLLLVFSEVSPKTLAALYPEKIALPTSIILQFLLKLLYPIIVTINVISNGILKLCGITVNAQTSKGYSREELRAVVHEATGRIPSHHRKMLLSILDLEKVIVDDIMVPRNEVVGINLEDDWPTILGQIINTSHTFLPVYEQDLNQLIGVLHVRNVLHLITTPEFNIDKLRQALVDALFIPQGTSLTQQLINFQQNRKRFSMVVDEYGDILGLITLEDILEQIVGEFSTDLMNSYAAILAQDDGSFLVDGSITIREFNRIVPWHFPTTGPKTINGLVIDYLQMIPEIGTCCLINDVPIEVVQVQDHRVKSIKVFPPKEN